MRGEDRERTDEQANKEQKKGGIRTAQQGMKNDEGMASVHSYFRIAVCQ